METHSPNHYPIRSISCPVVYEEEKSIHSCPMLRKTNVERTANRELPVHIFVDYGSGRWNMKVGLEFVQVSMCPFCGAKL